MANQRNTYKDRTFKGSKDGAENKIIDPEGGMLFALEVEDVEVAHFLECSGLKSTTEVFTIQEGGLNQFVHKLPGQSTWENIVLRYGVTADTHLLEWRDEVLQDDFSARRSGAIVVKNLQNEEVRRYSFKTGWPVAWEGPAFSADDSKLAVEMLEIAHHGVEVAVK